VSNNLLGITTHDEQILSAERVSDEKIKLKIWSLETGQVEKGGRTASYHVAPGEGTLILEKVGSKVRPFERSAMDGMDRKVVYWKEGQMPDGSPIKLQEKCGADSPAAKIAPVPAAARPDRAALRLRPGLWEITTTGESSGWTPMAPEVLARMTPEQRAEAETRIDAAIARQKEPRVYRHCMTQGEIDKGLANIGGKTAGLCSETATSSTETLRRGHVQCMAGTIASSSYDFSIEAKSPESLAGVWDITLTQGQGRPEIKFKNEIKGTWLATDCGSIKPQMP
jgi:hypothetical protein